MYKPKIHLEIIEQSPNESDPEGYSYLLCGLESAMKMTTDYKFVTCKHCLKRIGQNNESRRT